MSNEVKIVALIPTRGNRGALLDNCKRMMAAQTQPLYGMVVVDDPPKNEHVKDITYRYRIGVERIYAQYPDFDAIALIEDDDWYAPNYLEEMTKAWIKADRPEIFGIASTIYYHLGLKSWNYQVHPNRASAFSTFITRAIESLDWPEDHISLLDLVLWDQLEGKTFYPKNYIAVGIKHGIGLTGGIGHDHMWRGYRGGQDPDLEWFKETLDPISYAFYAELASNIPRQ